MSLKIFFTLCIVSRAIAGEYDLHEVSQISSPHLEHDDIGEGYESLDHGEGGGSSLEGYEGEEHHLEDIGTSVHQDDTLDYHSAANGASSYVKVKQDGDKGVSYSVDHSGFIGGGHGSGYGASSFGLETNHIYDSGHDVEGEGAAVSSSSYKDYTGKGSSYSVHQSHGHQGSASITSKDSSNEDHIQTTVFNSQSQGHVH